MRLAEFTPDEMKIWIPVIMTCLVAAWRVTRWAARVDYDLDNFGKLLNTEKSKARLAKKDKDY